jgi:hypothetical protein
MVMPDGRERQFYGPWSGVVPLAGCPWPCEGGVLSGGGEVGDEAGGLSAGSTYETRQ